MYMCVCKSAVVYNADAELSACLCGPMVGCMLQVRVCCSSLRSPPETKRNPDSNTISQIWRRMVDGRAVFSNYSVWYYSIPQVHFTS